MPRSNRRCATSLHDVGKWTVPRRWSLSSWLKAGSIETPERVATAVKPANKALIMGLFLGLGASKALYSEFSSTQSEQPGSPPAHRRSGGLRFCSDPGPLTVVRHTPGA